MSEVQLEGKLDDTLYGIAIAFFITLLFILPLGFFLARLSLTPIRESVNMMDSFINGIVHDINTPLSVINLNAQSLQKRLDDIKLRSKSERILQGVKHIESLEEQLLFMLRIHNYTPTFSNFNLQELLESRLRYYNDIRQSVVIKLEGKNVNINADKDSITRMIDNIVINAIKYSHPNSEVLISLQDKKLLIKDSGIGIKNPKEIFNKYYREAHSIKGLGLGLFVVHEVANLHKIKIEVESQQGKGTEFIVDLTHLSSANI